MRKRTAFFVAISLAVTIPAITIPFKAEAAVDISKTFLDLSSLSPQEQQKVDVLVSRGIISGFEDGTFRPQQSVTRGQFALFIARAFDLQMPYQPKSFKDVTPKVSTYEGILKAYHYNVVSGYPDGRFQPNNSIMRGAMAIMLDNMLQQSGNYNELKAPTYKDYASIGQRSIVPVHRLNNFGIMAPRANNYFKPNENGTRLETVLAIYNLLETTGKLKKDEIVTPPVTKPEIPTTPEKLDQLFKAGKSFKYRGFHFESTTNQARIEYRVDNGSALIILTPTPNANLVAAVKGKTNNGNGYPFGWSSDQTESNRTLYHIVFNAGVDLEKGQLENAIRQVNGKQKTVSVGNYTIQDVTDKYGSLLYIREK